MQGTAEAVHEKVDLQGVDIVHDDEGEGGQRVLHREKKEKQEQVTAKTREEEGFDNALLRASRELSSCAPRRRYQEDIK